MSPTGYHVGSILFHTLNAFILFLIIKLILNEFKRGDKKLEKPRTGSFFMAAALSLAFSSSYALSEAVFWIASITTLLESFFILLTLYLYGLFIFREKNKYLIASLAAFALGLGAKEGVFILVGVIPIFSMSLNFRFPPKKIWASWLYFFAVGGTFVLVASRIFSIAGKGGGYTFKIGLSLFRNIQQFVFSALTWTPFNDRALFQVQKQLIGAGGKSELDLGSPWLWMGIVCFLIILFMLIKGGVESRTSWLMLLAAAFPVSLPPWHLSGWFVYPYPLRTYYVPIIFFVLVVAIFIAGKRIVLQNKKVLFLLVGLFVIVSLANGYRVFQRANDWINEGRRFDSFLAEAHDKLASVSTPRVLIRVVERGKGRGKLIYKGIDINYNLALKWIFKIRDKRNFSIWVQKVRKKEAAYRFSEIVKEGLRDGSLTLYIYKDKRFDKITESDI